MSGRTAEAVEQLHQANDMLALYVYTPLTLADALVVAGKPEEARTYFDAAIDLAPDAGFAKQLATYKATQTGWTSTFCSTRNCRFPRNCARPC